MSQFHPILFCPAMAVVKQSETFSLADKLPIAEQLSLTIAVDETALPESGQLLQWDDQGLALISRGKKAPGPVRVDFTQGAADHRRKFGGGSGQMIAKAVGVKMSRPLQVLDATAGLGRDAFVLATLGCQMILQERQPIVAALLADGLNRAQHYANQQADQSLQNIIAAMQLTSVDSCQVMPAADVVYLDPMFPERAKSASVKKEMAVFHSLVGGDEDADQLLPNALNSARYRVVVKRPKKAPFLSDKPPSYQLQGKTSRFDVYVNAKLPD